MRKSFRKIFEAISSKKTAGAVFSKVDLKTPFIQDMIKKIADKSDEDPKDIENKIKEQVDKAIEKYKDKPKSFFGPMLENMVENIIFNMLPTDDYKLDEKLFYYMFDVILVKNRSFLKIVNPITGKRLKLSIILTPAPSFIKQPDWVKSVTTAAASPEGDVIFNIDFCKQLIAYADEKGVKPKGSMYQNKGGKVPDSYAYIEFLILHEIYHIVHADHFYQSKKKGMTGKMQNYLGDFITNYNLVKNGYDQLPIGLFSEKYNYDNYISMDAMQNKIIEEWSELSDDDKDKMDEQQDDHMDENHDEKDDDQEQDGDDQEQDGAGADGEPQDGDGTDGEPQDGDGADGEPQDGEPQDGDGTDGDGTDGEPQDGDGADGKGKPGEPQDGKPGDKSSGDENSPQNGGDSEMDKAFKDADKNFGDADDGMSQEELEQKIQEVKDEIAKDENDREDKRKEDLEQKEREAKKALNDKLNDIQTSEPIKWEKLIQNMIPKPVEEEEESMTKIHRRVKSQMAMGADKIAMKAGVIKNEKDSRSLLFLLDVSGSMADTISDVYIDLLKLIDKNKSNGITSMWILKFDSEYRVYRINLDLRGKKHTYQEVMKPKELLTASKLEEIKIKDNEKPIKDLFKERWGGGTDFPNDVFLIIKKFLKDDFNQVLFTDSDISYVDNLKNLTKACKIAKGKAYSFNIILNTKSTYNKIKQLMGGTYKYMSYLGDIK